MKLYKDGTIEGTPEEITQYIRMNSIAMEEPLNEEFAKEFEYHTDGVVAPKLGERVREIGSKFWGRVESIDSTEGTALVSFVGSGLKKTIEFERLEKEKVLLNPQL